MALAAAAAVQLCCHCQPQVLQPQLRTLVHPASNDAQRRSVARRYFAGLIVLLHSLVHQNAAEPDCGGLIVMWHPSFEETVLSETQRDELKCIAATQGSRYGVSYRRET